MIECATYIFATETYPKTRTNGSRNERTRPTNNREKNRGKGAIA